MRDFRDAKTMAQTLRAALAAKGHRISVGESLEFIAQAFGTADWNTLAALIRGDASPPPPASPASKGAEMSASWRHPLVNMSGQADQVFFRAVEHAKQRGHWGQFSREHFLLALTEDPDAVEMMRACGADVDLVKADVSQYLDGLPGRAPEDVPPGEAGWNGGFAILPAVGEAATLGQSVVTGAHILSIIKNAGGPTAQILHARGFNRRTAWNYMDAQAIEPRLPVAVDDTPYWTVLMDGDYNYDQGLKQSDRLRPAFRAAIAHATERRHRQATSVHLLLALADDPDAFGLMQACGVDPERVKDDAVRHLAGLPKDETGGAPAMPWLDARVRAAFEMAKRMGHSRLTGGHLLLGLLSASDDRASKILRGRGVDRERALRHLKIRGGS